ncbi:MAG TPA: hypothetical protein ENI66_00685 [Candidatus Yonathbacteria bacterium]|nr:hypothetical protein [Candidatus Yonathbacteria bacterium]
MKNQKITLVHTLYSIGFFTVFFGIGFVGGLVLSYGFLAGAIIFVLVAEIDNRWNTIIQIVGATLGWIFAIMLIGGFPFQEVLMAGAIFSSSFYFILGVKKLRRLIYGKG